MVGSNCRGVRSSQPTKQYEWLCGPLKGMSSKRSGVVLSALSGMCQRGFKFSK